MKISVLSKETFTKGRALNAFHLYSSNFAFISIFSTDDYDHHGIKNSANFLNLVFDDLSLEECEKYNYDKSRLFNEMHANLIIDFIENNLDKLELIIHCSAGISRSGAVAEFINDYYVKENYFYFKKRNPKILPNMYIYNVLKNEYFKRTETTYE